MDRYEQWHLSLDAAERYERVVARYILGPWVRVLVDAAGLSARERVLDLACGTGLVARAAAERVGEGGRVAGVDLNPGMIAVARTLSAPAGAAIEWITCSALDLKLPDASFDVVLCQQGLQFFPDRGQALREMHRVLVPGGRLALSVWRAIEQDPYAAALAAALDRHVSPEAARSLRGAYSLTDAEALQTLTTAAGFQDVSVRTVRLTRRTPAPEAFVLEHLAATPMAQAVAAAGDSARAALVQDVSRALAGYRDDAGMAVPAEIHLVVAHT